MFETFSQPDEKDNAEKGGNQSLLKSVRRQVCFTRSEMALVEKNAGRSGFTVNLYLREMALKGQIICRMNAEEQLIAREFIRLANQLHEDTLTCLREDAPGVAGLLLRYQQAIENHLNLLQKNVW